MLRPFDRLARFIARFRYPVSLPEDVAETLGIEVSNFLSFDELIKKLSCCHSNPLRLAKYMPRRQAENAFQHATCIDRFGRKTLVSYYFPEGWVEFVLEYDGDGLLRRMYLRHKGVESEQGEEVGLCCSYIGHRMGKKPPFRRHLTVG
jgi:hypothetical protein